jgi:uncharacterized protein YbjT (DUF2867 family)
MRILVTGGTGFTGGKLLERLVETTAAEIVLLVRPGTVRSRYERFEVDVLLPNRSIFPRM